MAISDAELESEATQNRYPLELQDLRTMLVIAGVDESIADQWINDTYAFGASLPTGVLAGQWIECLKQVVARCIQIASPIAVPPGQKRVCSVGWPDRCWQDHHDR